MAMIPEVLKRPRDVTVLVTGGRDFGDEYTLMDCLDRVHAEADARGLRLRILQSGATGAAAIARNWAWLNNIHYTTERALWRELYNAADPVRNQTMLDSHEVDLAIAMPGDYDTDDMVRRCKEAGIPVLP